MTTYLQCPTNFGILNMVQDMNWSDDTGMRRMLAKTQANLSLPGDKTITVYYKDHSLDESILTPIGVNKLISFFYTNATEENVLIDKLLELTEEDVEKKYWKRLNK